MVSSDQRRGAQIFACDLVRALREEGIDQKVVNLRDGSGGVDYEVNATSVSATRPLRGIQLDPWAAWRLRRVIRTWCPDIIQAHGGEALKYAVPASLGSHRPIVYRRIGCAPPWIVRGVRRKLFARLMRRAHRVVAVAEVIRREAISVFGMQPEHVVTIPNGVDARRLSPSKSREEVRRDLGVPSRAPIVLSVAALTWEKDPLTHIRIASKVLSDCPDAVHLVVGDGPMRGSVLEEIQRAGLTGRVLPLGLRTDIADLMQASDVLLFASRADGMEGMPAITIEAGMCGLAVAGFDIAGVSEVVDETTGFLVPSGDIEGLAARVVKLLQEEGLRQAMGAAAREACRHRFDVRTLAPQYLNVYREVVREP